MKKILILISKATVLILLLSLSSCYYDEEVVIPEVEPDPDVVVSFANEIQPIFTRECAFCHPVAAPPDLTEGNSYEDIINVDIVPFDLDASVLYQTLITTDPNELMPPGGALSNEDINLVKSWIEQGALDN